MTDSRKPQTDVKPAWESPTLRDVGTLGTLLEFPGGGKLSLIADDSGDAPRKPKGQEGK